MVDLGKTQIDELVKGLSENAADFVAELATSPLSIELVKTVRRVYATIHEFELRGPSTKHTVCVKVTHRPDELPSYIGHRQVSHAIERFLPRPDTPQLEYLALVAIEKHFQKVGDRRFAAVHPSGMMLDGWAFVMDKVRGRTLSQLLRKVSFGRGKKLGIGRLIHNSGAWLREFHNMDALPHSQPDAGQPDALSAGQIKQDIVSLAEFVNAHGPFDISKAVQALTSAADSLAISPKCCRVAHHDFAPRNIFITPARSLVVIDTLAEFRRPVYEDLAHFLVELRLNRLQIMTRGLAFSQHQLQNLENEFLTGYFGSQNIPRATIRQFEARAILIRWAVALWEWQQTGQDASPGKHSYRAASQSSFWQRLLVLCNELNNAKQSVPLATSRMTVSSRPAAADERAAIEDQLRRRAPMYWNAVDSWPTIKLLGTCNNKFSNILKFQIESNGIRRQIVVKQAKHPNRSHRITKRHKPTELVDRPRLTPLIEPEQEIRLELDALSQIHQFFGELQSPLLKSVPVLDFLTAHSALVMEHVDAPTLAELLRRKGKQQLECVFANVGLWLRTFHGISIKHSTDLGECNNDIRAHLKRYTEFLGRHLNQRDWFRDVCVRLVEESRQLVETELPLRTCHGDFAPQNIFVGDNAEISTIDTLAFWQKPIFEDIAHFLYVVNQCGTGRSRQTLESYRQHFLHGYFADESVPGLPIDLFAALIIFDKWSSAVWSHLNSTGIRRQAKRARMLVRNRGYRANLIDVLTRIENRVLPNDALPKNIPN